MKPNQKVYIVLIVLVLAIFGFKTILLDNEDFLASATEFFDNPSKPYFFCLNRIYRLSQQHDIKEKFTNYLIEGKNQNLHNLYTRVLGVMGQSDTAEHLMKPFVQFQNDPNNKSRIYYIIDSMGLSGNPFYISPLQGLLANYEEHRIMVPKYQIARSLYLITGNRYKVNEEQIHITNELKTAREVISSSMNRKRTYEEMLVLDKILRPPN